MNGQVVPIQSAQPAAPQPPPMMPAMPEMPPMPVASIPTGPTAAYQPQPQAPAPAPAKTKDSGPGVINDRLFVQVLTVPDFERMAQLGLPALPPLTAREPVEKLPPVHELANSQRAIKTLLPELEKLNPCVEWCEIFLEMERGNKNRKQVTDWLENRINGDNEASMRIYQRIDETSMTPEFASVCALSFARGKGAIHTVVVGQKTANADVTERALLALFWRMADYSPHIVSWGDPSSMFIARSLICGIDKGTIRDLTVERLDKHVVGSSIYPHTLSDVCRWYGVGELQDPLQDQEMIANAWSSNEFPTVSRSCEVRLVMLRDLWQRWDGYFVGRE
mgnify:FL=1